MAESSDPQQIRLRSFAVVSMMALALSGGDLGSRLLVDRSGDAIARSPRGQHHKHGPGS